MSARLMNFESTILASGFAIGETDGDTVTMAMVGLAAITLLGASGSSLAAEIETRANTTIEQRRDDFTSILRFMNPPEVTGDWA